MSEQTTQPKPASDDPKFRYTAAVAADIEPKWQDYWAANHTFEVPDRPADTVRAQGLHPGHVPVPLRRRPARRPPAGLHRHRRAGPVQDDDRPQRAAHDRLRRLRPGRRAVRGRARHAPAGQHRGATSPATRSRSTASASATTPGAGCRPSTCPSTSGRSGSSCRSSTPGTTTHADQARPISQADRAVRRRRAPHPGRPRLARRCPRRSRPTIIDSHRLAYIAEAPVNWCPGLGTVLSNEEVTADGRSERGNFPVFKRNLRQWMMRITKYGDRLLADLDRLDWPEPIKLQQRNWIGRSEGARVHFPVTAVDGAAEDHRDLHDPPRHAVRRHLHGAGARARAGRLLRGQGVAGGHPREVDRRARHPGRGRRRLPALPPPRRPRSSGRPRAGRRPACSPARSR